MSKARSAHNDFIFSRLQDEDEAEPKRKMCEEKAQNHFYEKLLKSVVDKKDLPSAYEVVVPSGP